MLDTPTIPRKYDASNIHTVSSARRYVLMGVRADAGGDELHRAVDGLLHSVSPCAVKPPPPSLGGGGFPCLSGLDWRYHSDSGVEVPVVARAVAVCEPVVELDLYCD